MREVSPEAQKATASSRSGIPAPSWGARTASGSSCPRRQGRSWNLGGDFADKDGSAAAIQYGRGSRRRQPSPPGGSLAPRQAATPVQTDLDAPPASRPARASLGSWSAGSSSSPSPWVRPTFPFSSYTPRLGKTDKGAVHSLRGALTPLPHGGVAVPRASLGPPRPSGDTRLGPRQHLP